MLDFPGNPQQVFRRPVQIKSTIEILSFQVSIVLSLGNARVAEYYTKLATIEERLFTISLLLNIPANHDD